MRGARYRVWQFWRLLTGRMSPVELARVQGWLAPPLFALFCKMTPAEQWHAYCVRQTLLAQGQTDSELLTAALLHDVGKSRLPLAGWEKAAAVLGFRVAPRTVRAWGDRPDEIRWWRRSFVVARQHPAWGAEMVGAAGGSPLMVELIRRHQDPVSPGDELYELLSALQSADDNN